MGKPTFMTIFPIDMSPPSSRRRFLALCATGCVASLAGCKAINSSNDTQSTATPEIIQSASGRVWQKEVEVKLTQSDPAVWTEVLRLQFDREQNEVFGGFDPEYIESAPKNASLTISSETHDTLITEFGQVRYNVKLGPISEDGNHLHAQARRDAFNHLPLAGRVSVENFWVQETDDLRVGYVRPTETKPPIQSPTSVDIDQFNLGDSFDGY